jgi:hypothetical protein
MPDSDTVTGVATPPAPHDDRTVSDATLRSITITDTVPSGFRAASDRIPESVLLLESIVLPAGNA